MLERMEIVEWCKKCKYFEKSESDDPCWDCLCDPVKVASHKPTKYEEAKE